MMTYDYKGKPIDMQVSMYENMRNNEPCLKLTYVNRDALFKIPSKVTSNVGPYLDGKSLLIPKFSAYINATRSDFDELRQFLEVNGIAKPIYEDGKVVMNDTGGHYYPLYQFSQEKLSEIDPQGVMKFEQDYGRRSHVKGTMKDIYNKIAEIEQANGVYRDNDDDGFEM